MKTCSIIVPIYNASPYLAQCLTSLKMQTYQDVQIIMIDDGSTDDSSAIAQSFVDSDARFMLFSQPNAGQSTARNEGLRMANGKYVVFVDADDYLDVDFIANHLAQIGNADYVQSSYRRVDTNGEVLQEKIAHYPYRFVSPCMRLYRLDYLRNHDLRFADGMIYEDVLFSLTLWGKSPHVKMYNYCGYNYRSTPLSTTSCDHPMARKQLFSAIRNIDVHWWIKWMTMLRLYAHFIKRSL